MCNICQCCVTGRHMVGVGPGKAYAQQDMSRMPASQYSIQSKSQQQRLRAGDQENCISRPSPPTSEHAAAPHDSDRIVSDPTLRPRYIKRRWPPRSSGPLPGIRHTHRHTETAGRTVETPEQGTPKNADSDKGTTTTWHKTSDRRKIHLRGVVHVSLPLHETKTKTAKSCKSAPALEEASAFLRLLKRGHSRAC